MPAIRFIERRNKAALVEKVGPFERGSDLFWREYGWQVRIAALHNAGRSEPIVVANCSCGGWRWPRNPDAGDI